MTVSDLTSASGPLKPTSSLSAIAARRLVEETRANRARYQLVAAVLVVALALLGALVGLAFRALPVGFGIGIAIAVLLLGFAPGLGERLALRAIGAKPADPGRFPRYQNLVEGLCEELGTPVPRLWVVESDAANALALGRGPAESAIVATSGLLSSLNRVELEGVLAAELAHVRTSSARLGSLAVVLGGAGGLLLEARQRGGNPLLGAAGWVLTGMAPLRRLAVPVERHLRADESAGYLTRYPPGLAGALRKLSGQAGAASVSNVGLNHLWLVDPLAGVAAPGDGSLPRFHSHPPLEDRLENLSEL